MGSLLDVLASLSGTVGTAAPHGIAGPHGIASPEPTPHAPSPRRSEAPALPLRGQGLRYALSLELRDAGELTVGELVQRLAASGHEIVGRPSKAVSDALRWEIGHGRATRVGRGRYRTGRIPRSTLWWMRRALDRIRTGWRAALDAGIDVADWSTPAPRHRRSPDAPRTGLDHHRRQQRARRAWEATLADRPTWRATASRLRPT